MPGEPKGFAMSDSILLVHTNRANSALNMSIAAAIAVLLTLFTIHHISVSTFLPETPNEWVRAIFDNIVLVGLTMLPLYFLGRVVFYHLLVITRGYVAILDDAGIRIVRHGRMQIVPWDEMLEFSISDRIMEIGINRSIRPGQRRVHRERISLRYSDVTTAEILRRVAYERPDLLNADIRRDS